MTSSNPDPGIVNSRAEGVRLFQRKDFSRALTCLDQWLSLHPEDRDILNYKARTLEGLGRLEESLRCVDRCLELAPEDVAELCNRALMLTKLSRRNEALASLDRVLAIQPNHVDVLTKRAYLLHQLDRREAALASAHQAVLAEPTHLNAINTRGMILDDLGRRAEALADFQQILAIDPDYSDAITNRAILYARGGEFQEALAGYDRSLSINPDQPNAFYNRAVIRLVLGDWAQGFREFECRWKLFPHEAARLTRLGPLWLGQCDIKGKTILLHHEQGFGDTLQFCRYVALVKQRGAHVVIAVPAALRRLMETLPGSPTIVSEGETVPAHDFHCPLMSLPLAFGTTPGTVPGNIPYLHADPALARRWSERLGERRRPRIGLVWSGRRYPPINDARDMTLDAIRPLLAADADFYCLHTELSDDERSGIAAFSNVVWLGERLDDFADTAGFVINLDLVITVDSAVAHLAGALGKPVWVMNRYASCWRWLLNRMDSPWYPSLRLFRQPLLGDWTTVVEDVRQAVAVFLANRKVALSSSSHAHCESVSHEADILEPLQAALDLHNGGQIAEAIAIYHRILVKGPSHGHVLHYLGIALSQRGQHEEALGPLAQAIILLPDNAAVHTHYGNALAGMSRFQEAIESYDRAIAYDGSFSEGHYNRGIALASLGQHEAALVSYTKALECDPNHSQAHNNRGNVLMDLGRWDEARSSYERAIQIQPVFVGALVNRTHLSRRQHRYVEALGSADEAVSHGPNDPGAHNSRGAVLADMGRLSDALECYDRAITLDPSFAEPLWNKSLIELARGDYQEGWKHYESRWGVKSLKLIPRFKGTPSLRPGDSVVGKEVLLHAEQGYGDTIQFSRYAAMLAARGARVILSVPGALQSLMAVLPGVHEVVGQGVVSDFDFQCPLISAPLVCGTELSTIPATVPYLSADQTAAARWAAKLAPRVETFRIGLAWSGRPSHPNDGNRSIPLKQLLPITRFKARWVSLQKEVRTADESCLESLSTMDRCGERLTDFADAAALIEHLDLVIAVDTAIAHLAGAMGKPVWILLPYVADWRWLRDRQDSPWYPTARLFRQTEPKNWLPVISRVREGLHAFGLRGEKRRTAKKRHSVSH
jgi:tetratricopeptide (TPR) repeat protein